MSSTGRNGQDLISPVPGPICRSAPCVLRMFKTLNDSEQEFEDTLLDYVPWNESEFQDKRPLRIGYVESISSVFEPCLAQKRALSESIELAKKSGHEMIKLDYDFGHMYKAFMSVLGHGNKLKELTAELKGEEPIEEYKMLFLRN